MRIDLTSWRRLVAASLTAAAVLGAIPPVSAQDGQSIAVVQPLPPPAADDLNIALRKLGRSPDDLSALLDAGEASIKLEDADAAEGFFTRALEIAPGNYRAKAGLAAVLLRDENPFDALRLFAEAEAAGAPMIPMAADRGLAYDLVGNNDAAQEEYRRVLSEEESAEVRKRFAISLAIAGDQYGSEAMLLPLLQRQDRSAYRARTFALAALGREEEAVAIAEALLPPRIATRLTPYLRYMPRLTRAQQAAAANLGNFPTADDIGKDDPRVAEFAQDQAVRVARGSSDSRLVPGGEPLGRSAPQAAVVVQPVIPPTVQIAMAPPPPVRVAIAAVVTAPPEAEVPVTVADPVRIAQARTAAELPAAEPSQAAPVPEPGFDLAAVSGSATPVVSPPPPAPVSQAVVQAIPQPRVETPVAAVQVAVLDTPPVQAPSQSGDPAPAESAPEPLGLAEAFADFTLPGNDADPAPGAVDITAIKPPREVEKEPEPEAEPAKPAPPAHPSRVWVQVATGRDISALAFDWRRLTRNSDDLLKGREAFTAKWGQTNRLVTGPFANRRAALDMVEKLKQVEVDSFMFTSSEGEEVKALP